ncbi:MAG: phosphotransferase [Actinomycetota bacterium]
MAASLAGIAIAGWPGIELIERVQEGNRNEVWRGRMGSTSVSVRRSRRSPESLGWELDLIANLAAAGFRVAQVVPSTAGQPHHEGVVVQRWLDGRAPGSDDDWTLVAATLRRVHAFGPNYPQRPGCLSSPELTRTSRSVDAHMDALPDDVAALVLTVFAEMRDVPTTLIHGDPTASNLRIDDDGRVGLLDFDESRVDLSWHDLSNLGVEVLPTADHAQATRLSHAWETANAWVAEPDYARQRLAALERGS